MRGGLAGQGRLPAGRAWPTKVLVVVEPRAVVTVTIRERSVPFAALGYGVREMPRDPRGSVPLTAGSRGVRFVACRHANPGAEPWNRGTQFPGYFLVSGRRCVDLTVSYGARPTVVRRTLRFGAPRCPK